MLDRFDMIIEVPEVPISVLTDPVENESTEAIKTRINAAREMAATRQAQGQMGVNADLNPDLVDKLINIDDKGKTLVKTASEKNALSARGYHRVLRVARTIAVSAQMLKH